jgi:ABC-type nitrate/sulfonate/bicarbonate transport system substrate-binding protein
MFAALVLVGASSHFGCRRPSPQAQALELGIIAPSLDYLPLKVAEARGLLTEKGDTTQRGVPIKLRRFNAGWELGEALLAGRVDVAIIPFTYVVSAVARGGDVRIIACFEHEDDGIIARPGITTLEGLAGRKIGCLKASTIELLLRQTLDSRGIRAELVYFSSPMEMWSALERGEVDALSYYVPGIIKADGKIGNIIHWYSAEWPMHPCCDIAVHRANIRNKTKAVQRLVQALKAGTELIARDTALACSVAVQTYGLSDAVALQSLRHTPFRLSLTHQDTVFELNTAALMTRLGYLPSTTKRREIYQAGFVAGELAHP